MTENIINLTPHDITLLPADGEPITIPSTGVARCQETTTAVSGAGLPVPLQHLAYGEVTGLPDPAAGTVVIVSQLVCRALPGREDLVFPADLVRDESGTIVGCRALARPAN